MQLNITGKNIELTPALKNHVEEKYKKIKHFEDLITSTHIVLHVQGINQIAEGMQYLEGTELHATAETDDMYKSIDALFDKLATQIKKHKDKMTSHR